MGFCGKKNQKLNIDKQMEKNNNEHDFFKEA